ncbi:MAG: alpha/beta fold hydrolase, partial [Ignavibacteriaceae bacterium]
MRKLIPKIFLIIFVFSMVIPNKSFSQDNDISGIWNGSLKVSGIQLRIVFNISKEDNGSYKATMDSPDQGAKDIPVQKITFQENKIKMEMPALRGEYNGTLGSDGNKIEGTWAQSGQSFQLDLQNSDKPTVLNRPQEPKEPFPYNSEDVTYENDIAGNTLAGTFTYTKSDGPFPAVILITGSGPQNRNEELLGHKPFLVLSDYLTRHGIAVLRFDDRGIGKSTGDFKSATSKDFATDVLAGVKYLKTRNEVNKNEIGLIGHSEGGLIAPMVAVKSPDVAFIVLMAGPGLPGDQILLMQSALISKAGGASKEDIEKSEKVNKKIYEILRNEPDSVKAHEEIVIVFKNYYNSLSEEDKKKAGDENTALQMLKRVETPWFKQFLKYDPRPTLEKVTC